MAERVLDEAAVREMLEGAIAFEPPIGPAAQQALRAGLRRRRRRRVSGTAAVVAAVSALVLAGPALTRSASDGAASVRLPGWKTRASTGGG